MLSGRAPKIVWSGDRYDPRWSSAAVSEWVSFTTLPTSSIILFAIQCHIGYVHLFHDLLLPPIHPSVVYYARVKPNAQRKTELNWTRSFSWVQFSFPLCTEPATSCDDRRRPSQVLDSQKPSQLVAGFRPSTDIALIGRFTSVSRLWRTCDDRRFLRRIVAGRRRFNAQRETELNWAVQLSSIQFTSVSRCTLGFSSKLFFF